MTNIVESFVEAIWIATYLREWRNTRQDLKRTSLNLYVILRRELYYKRNKINIYANWQYSRLTFYQREEEENDYLGVRPYCIQLFA